MDQSATSETLSEMQDIIEREIQAIRNIPLDENLLKATALIFERVHQQSGKLVVTGVGKAGEIGQNIATTFSSTGTPSVFLHPLEAVHGNIGMIQDQDIVLALSNSGQTRELLELLPIAKRLIPGLPILSITGFEDSPLVELSDVALSTGRPTEICPLGMTPTTSTTVMTVLGDILVYLMMKKIGFSREEYGKRHHGGYLGSLARGTDY
ncbi:MAG: SIS domain-containing protein [Alphaproteobacteria bacterium]|nr:SIS domain-containing protein [Alphaproteobacteria bacterium]